MVIASLVVLVLFGLESLVDGDGAVVGFLGIHEVCVVVYHWPPVCFVRRIKERERGREGGEGRGESDVRLGSAELGDEDDGNDDDDSSNDADGDGALLPVRHPGVSLLLLHHCKKKEKQNEI